MWTVKQASQYVVITPAERTTIIQYYRGTVHVYRCTATESVPVTMYTIHIMLLYIIHEELSGGYNSVLFSLSFHFILLFHFRTELLSASEVKAVSLPFTLDPSGNSLSFTALLPFRVSQLYM